MGEGRWRKDREEWRDILYERIFFKSAFCFLTKSIITVGFKNKKHRTITIKRRE